MTTPTHSRSMDGYFSPRCQHGMDGCDDLACVCTCHGSPAVPGCPKCGTILNAQQADCDGEWHSDNQPAPAAPTEPQRTPEALDVLRAKTDWARSGHASDVMVPVAALDAVLGQVAATGRYLLVTFMVTSNGERGHPMNTIVKRIDLADDASPTPATLERLTAAIAREVSRKATAETRCLRTGGSQ